MMWRLAGSVGARLWILGPTMCMSTASLTFSHARLVQLGEVYPDGFYAVSQAGNASVLFGRGTDHVYGSSDVGNTWAPLWEEEYINDSWSGFPMDLLRDEAGRLHDFGNASLIPLADGSYTAFNSTSATYFDIENNKVVQSIRTVPQGITFQGLPVPLGCNRAGLESCWWNTASGGARLADGTYVQTQLISWLGGSQGSTAAGSGILAFTSPDSYRWTFTSFVARAADFPLSGEGPNEHDLAVLADGSLIVVMRLDAGDGSAYTKTPYKNYYESRSKDGGKTWSHPEPIPGNVGCARPRLRMLNGGRGPLLLTGGRLRNHGTTDIYLWVNHDGLATTWDEPISLTYWHNSLISDPSLKFTASVNTSNARETDSYTSIMQVDPTTVVVAYNRKAGTFAPAPPVSASCQILLDAACNGNNSQAATCRQSIQKENETLPLYARNDYSSSKQQRAWRCYSGSALDKDKQHYIGGDGFCTMTSLLDSVLMDGCHWYYGLGAIFTMRIQFPAIQDPIFVV